MSDIVESLEHQLDEFDSGKAIHFDYSGLRALIAEIRRQREENTTLRARLEKAREVVEPFRRRLEDYIKMENVFALRDADLTPTIAVRYLRLAAAFHKELTDDE